MAEVFYLSDPHFGHKGILKFRPQFKTIEEHDNLIIENCNKILDKRDLLWVFGDLGHLPTFDRIKGQKNCILGNHDEKAMPQELMKRFHKIYGATTRIHLKGFRVIGTHIPIHPQEFYGWEFNIHGHTHSNKVLLPNGEHDLRYVPICCEDTNFAPLSREDLLEQLQCRKELIQENPSTYPPFKRGS